MGDYAEKSDHREEGLSRLLAQFKGKPRLEALLGSYLDQIQELDTQISTIASDRFIAAAYGVQLDGIGEILGEERQGVDDDDYRAFLRARGWANRSDGRLEDLIKIATLIQGDTSPGAVYAQEFYPAAMRIEPIAAVTVNALRVSRLLNRAKGGGIALRFYFSKAARANTFLFDDGADPGQVTDDQCLADGQNTPLTIGGLLSGVFG